jgi:hypothetical protein
MALLAGCEAAADAVADAGASTTDAHLLASAGASGLASPTAPSLLSIGASTEPVSTGASAALASPASTSGDPVSPASNPLSGVASGPESSPPNVESGPESSKGTEPDVLVPEAIPEEVSPALAPEAIPEEVSPALAPELLPEVSPDANPEPPPDAAPDPLPAAVPELLPELGGTCVSFAPFAQPSPGPQARVTNRRSLPRPIRKCCRITHP